MNPLRERQELVDEYPFAAAISAARFLGSCQAADGAS